MSPTLRRARTLSAWNLLGTAADRSTFDFPPKPYDQEKRARAVVAAEPSTNRS